MKKADVPQQVGLNAGCNEVNYALDEQGRYSLESSAGWEAKTIALRQAWEEIDAQLRAVIVAIKAGTQSALAYHMLKAQMDASLLAQYSGVARWRVKRHLKPALFAKLGEDQLSRYARVFAISVEVLCQVPDEPDLKPTESMNL